MTEKKQMKYGIPMLLRDFGCTEAQIQKVMTVFDVLFYGTIIFLLASTGWNMLASGSCKAYLVSQDPTLPEDCYPVTTETTCANLSKLTLDIFAQIHDNGALRKKAPYLIEQT